MPEAYRRDMITSVGGSHYAKYVLLLVGKSTILHQGTSI